jgi:hypothetical protein
MARHEVVASGYKFMKREADAEVSTNIKKIQKRVAEATRSTDVCTHSERNENYTVRNIDSTYRRYV